MILLNPNRVMRWFGRNLYFRPGASLNYPFAVNGSLSGLGPALTFTRASSQTYFDSTGTLQSATTNVAAFDYNPTTLAPLGLSMWEARTNSIRNNTMVGAVAGTPGTAPTNWVFTIPAGITQTISNVTTTNGISTFDVRFSGTTGSAAGIQIKFDGNAGAITGAVAAQSWNQSAWVALIAGALTNISGQRLIINEYSAGPTYLRTSVCATSVLAAGATLTRVNGTVVLGASTTILEPILILDASSGVAIDITLRIGLPQLELGAFATPVISTSAAAATRAAPVCSTTDVTWYNAAAGTFVVSGKVGAPSTYTTAQPFFSVGDGTTTNRIQVFRASGGNSALIVASTASGLYVNAGAVAIADGATTKLAAAYANADYALYVGGSNSVAASTAGTLPICTSLQVGNRSDGAVPVNGWISSLSYYPTRLPNATLQALST